MPVPCRSSRVRAGGLGGPWGVPGEVLAGGLCSRDTQSHGNIGGCWEVTGAGWGVTLAGGDVQGSLGVSSKSWGLCKSLGGCLCNLQGFWGFL